MNCTTFETVAVVLSSWVVLVIVAVLAAIFLNRTIYGRYLLALGRNEDAARYSGIRTERLLLLAYVVCSLLAGVGGVLFALDVNSVAPDKQGNFYELYAIAAAVLGGIGNLPGAVVGGLLLGLIESIGSGYLGDLTGGVLGSHYTDILAFVVLIIMLTLRPSGLLGERVADRA